MLPSARLRFTIHADVHLKLSHSFLLNTCTRQFAISRHTDNYLPMDDRRPGSKGHSKNRNRSDNPEVRTSKFLSYLLRHGAEKEGLKMRSDGYVNVDDLVRIHYHSPRA